MARLPKGTPTLRDVLREQRRQLRSQGTSSPFTNSGLAVTAPGVVDASQATVLFAPSSIGNDALASPYGDADKAAVSQASTDAAAAKSTADTAQIAAGAAQATANGKNAVYRLPLATPPSGTLAAGDLWFVTDEGNRIQQWSGTAWTAFGFGDQAISNLDAGTIKTGTLSGVSITGVTVTGATVQTSASVPSSLRMDDQGGLVAYNAAGGVNFQIFNKAEANNPTGDFSGAKVGSGAGLRIGGATANDATFAKVGNGFALQMRAAGSVAKGAGIDLYEAGVAAGNDTDGDAIADTLRFYTGGLTRGKVTAGGVWSLNSVAVPGMRMVQTGGGDVTSRSLTTYGVITNAPIRTFFAPPSGTVKVDILMSLRATVAGTYALGDFEVKTGGVEGSGTTVRSPGSLIANCATTWARIGGAALVFGLTPGAQYYVRALFASDSTTQVQASAVNIIVSPSL